MNRLKFWKREERAAESYTDLLQRIQYDAAVATSASVGATAGLEAASGLIGRAFASADVVAAPYAKNVLTPDVLTLTARQLIRRGEIVFLIEVVDGELSLIPAASHDVDGGPRPSTWRYRITTGGPDRTHTHRRVTADSVVHIRYSYSPAAPWRGQGPLQVATLAGKLSAHTANALANEAAGPHGSFVAIPSPVDGTDDTVILAKFREDIRKAKGDIVLGEAGDWDESGQAGRNVVDYTPQRFGADPPEPLVSLHSQAFQEILGACGVHPSLVRQSDGTSMREGYRLLLHSNIAGLGKLASHELSIKLGTPVEFNWRELRAADIAGRARAFATMVSGNMPIQDALANSGLMGSMSEE